MKILNKARRVGAGTKVLDNSHVQPSQASLPPPVDHAPASEPSKTARVTGISNATVKHRPGPCTPAARIPAVSKLQQGQSGRDCLRKSEKTSHAGPHTSPWNGFRKAAPSLWLEAGCRTGRRGESGQRACHGNRFYSAVITSGLTIFTQSSEPQIICGTGNSGSSYLEVHILFQFFNLSDQLAVC